jgi:carbohydrate-binding DOMON domain-containing protein
MDHTWDFTVIVACALAAVLAVSGTLVLQAQKAAQLTAERDAAVAALESKIESERTATESELARLQSQAGKSTTVTVTQEVKPEITVEALVTIEEKVRTEAATAMASERERAIFEETELHWDVLDLQLRTIALELEIVSWQLVRYGEKLEEIELGLREVVNRLSSIRRALGLKPEA